MTSHYLTSVLERMNFDRVVQAAIFVFQSYKYHTLATCIKEDLVVDERFQTSLLESLNLRFFFNRIYYTDPKEGFIGLILEHFDILIYFI